MKKFFRGIPLVLGMVKAVLLAAPYVRSFPDIRGLVRAAGVALGFGKRVDPVTLSTRMRACSECPIFTKSQTCGSLPHDGCGCYMPVKAMLPESQCWLFTVNPSHPDHLGWPKRLNGQ